ncbi:MAG: sortase [Frankiales bacterium]|jgi:sortase A|nr:sortase [Frankiales bacterium]
MATLTTPAGTAIPAQNGAPAPPPAVPRTRPALAVVIGNVLLLAGVLLLAFAGYLTTGSRLQQAHSQNLLYDQLRVTLKHSTTPVAEPIIPGTPIAMLQSPRLGGSQVVVEGTAGRDLMRGPGHRPDTPLPGQQGVSVIFGRALAYGGPFGELQLLRVGDPVTVVTGQGRFTYRIDSVRRSDQSFTRLPAAASRLSLVTSDGSWTPSQYWVASGTLVAGTPYAVPVPGLAAPVQDQPLQGDSGSAVALLLWSQLLLVVVALAAWGWLRLPRVIVWVGATPVALAVLWNVFTNLSALLPNLL